MEKKKNMAGIVAFTGDRGEEVEWKRGSVIRFLHAHTHTHVRACLVKTAKAEQRAPSYSDRGPGRRRRRRSRYWRLQRKRRM